MAEKSLDSRVSHHDHILRIKELEVRQDGEANKRDMILQAMGLVFAFIIVLVGIGGSFYAAFHGHNKIALTIGGTTIVGVVGAFLWRRTRPE